MTEWERRNARRYWWEVEVTAEPEDKVGTRRLRVRCSECGQPAGPGPWWIPTANSDGLPSAPDVGLGRWVCDPCLMMIW